MGRDVRWNRAEAIVRDTKDPSQRGAIRVECEAIGEKGQALSTWIQPEFFLAGTARGFFFVPEIGEKVVILWVTSSSGEQVPGETGLTTPQYRWIAQTYGNAAPPSVLTTDYGKRVGFADAAGNAVVLDAQNSKAFLLGQKVLLGAETGTLPVARETDPVRVNAGNLFTGIASAATALNSAGIDPVLAGLAPAAAGFLVTAATALQTVAEGTGTITAGSGVVEAA